MDPQLAKAKTDMHERMEILPEELVTLITDGTVPAIVFLIQEKYALNSEQAELLENEIIFVLALFLPSHEFSANIEESLGLEQAIAQAIADEIDEEIFSLVQDILDTVEKARKEINTNLGTVNLQAKLEKKDDLNKLAESFQTKDPQRLRDPNVQEYTENVEPIRTMEEDMGRVHGYGAYRDMYKDEENKDDTSAT